MLALIHYNDRLAHQVDHATAFLAGFARHGIRAQATCDIYAEADIHVVSGVHYALPYWQVRHDARVVLLDRAYWGDPECVSLGWLLPDGGRHYAAGMPSDRWLDSGQTLAPLRPATGRRIFLADYGAERHHHPALMDREQITCFRAHPSTERAARDLAAVLADYDVAYGFKTSALVTAGLHGLNIVALDPRAIAARWCVSHRERWCYDLAYANWSLAEIASGAAWEHLEHAASPGNRPD